MRCNTVFSKDFQPLPKRRRVCDLGHETEHPGHRRQSLTLLPRRDHQAEGCLIEPQEAMGGCDEVLVDGAQSTEQTLSSGPNEVDGACAKATVLTS